MKEILALLVLVAAVGCSAASFESNYQDWATEPTPAIWNLDSDWVLLLTNHEGRLIRSLTVRFTDEVATTCIGGEWRKVEIITERPSRPSAFSGEPAYQLVGSALEVDLSANLCDSYYPMRGRLSANGVEGRHGSEHMFGEEIVGHFVGAPIN